jgi:hypothetical protein
MGWSDRASVCLAVEKTGNVISAAGLIMSISFAGMRPTLNMSICDVEQAVYCTVLYCTVLYCAVLDWNLLCCIQYMPRQTDYLM